MTSRELLYVKTVADERYISSAARKLYIAQPSLSQSLQKIEDSIGTKLFNRTNAGLRLTFAGEKYYQMACQVMKIYDDFEAEITDMNDLRSGHIRFGISNHLGSMLLPRILPAFKERCPNISISISEDSTNVQESKLISGDLDFSIMHAPVEQDWANPSLRYENLARHPFVIAIARNHPLVDQAVPREGYPYPVLDVRLLKEEPLLTLSKEQRIRHITDAVLKKAKITPDVRLESRNYMTLERLAGVGVGYTMLPNDYINPDFCPEPPAYLSIDTRYGAFWSLCIATLENGFISRADEFFLSLVRDYFLSHDA